MEEQVIPHHSLTYGTSRLAPAISLVDRAKEIRALKEEAELILQQAEKDIELHKAKCQFEKKPGQMIYLYAKESGDYFSLLSPNEWGNKPPHPFKAAYMMNPDRSFTEIPLEPKD
ncbi:DUF2452 domain-containing protein [Leptospira kemamanensis]|uniref:DUF2452 domain-containing protein n=1 Tax=Leptospira kemamanensis TaxID=2484942 RepID=A0A4R9JP07_9LEPT|nr:DUF2452 domain-containing protein [Leptospira kemamanensis]TGL48736.1 DUF2452 domain-containing protein [Leptospira kemamanensis]